MDAGVELSLLQFSRSVEKIVPLQMLPVVDVSLQHSRAFGAFVHLDPVNFSFFWISGVVFVQFFMKIVFLINFILDLVLLEEMLRHGRFIRSLVPGRKSFGIPAAVDTSLADCDHFFFEAEIFVSSLFWLFRLLSFLTGIFFGLQRGMKKTRESYFNRLFRLKPEYLNKK